MPGKFGTRKSPGRMNHQDIVNANELSSEVLDIINKFGKELGIPIPSSFPDPIQWPCPGKNNDSKGRILMDYTLTASKYAYLVLKMAHRRYGYIYKIDVLPRRPVSLYHVQVCYVGHPFISCVHGEYIESLIWVLKMLRSSLEIRNRNMNNG